MKASRRFACVLLVLCAGSAGSAPSSLQAAVPTRIVSTSPSITETLFALGLGDRVVGVSAYCRFPAKAATLPKVGSFLKPDAELIAALRPDLVIVHEVANGIDRRLASLRIPFLIVDRGTLASVFSSIRQIGGSTGVPERADALVADIERRLEAIRRAGAGVPRPRVLFIIGRRPGTLADLVAVGPGSYLNDLVEIAGGANVLAIAGQPEYPRISMEAVLRLNPDVIIDTVDMGDTAAERTARQPINEKLWNAYPMLTAVRMHRLRAATTDALVVPGPRVVEAAQWVAALIRGGSAP
ncbi:MAG TPA: helical backbone metal receptor [Vicinamibacterales bacterium]|jgi:iron complex transport system substrate-binding protein